MITKQRFGISMDKNLVGEIDKNVEEGRYTSRSQCIETCVRQIFRLEKSDERIADLTIEMMELAAKSPEFVDECKKILKKRIV